MTVRPLPTRDDRGSALVMTMLVMSIVLVLGTTILHITVNNLGSAKRSQDAAGALDAADAGVTQAISHLRRNGARALRCSPACSSNAWGNQSAPTSVELPGSTDQRYSVWIEGIPAGSPTFYRVHSTGYSNGGRREVQVDVELALRSIALPIGIFARTVVGGGTADVTNESIYTTGCVYNRRHIDISGTDPLTGLPAAVHSARIITDANGNNPTCSVDNKAIHKTNACNTSFPYDHDQIGGALSRSGSCASALSQAHYDRYYSSRDLDNDGDVDVNGSYLQDANALRSLFAIDDDPVSASELDQLREVAREQGNYWTTPTMTKQPDEQHAVLYFDFRANPGQVVDLKDITSPVHRRASTATLSADDPACADASLLIVIEAGNARYNSNPNMAASLLLASKAPYGEIIKANGTAGLIGTIFSDKLNLVGTFEASLDQCFLANLAPSIYDVSVSNYLEVDR